MVMAGDLPGSGLMSVIRQLLGMGPREEPRVPEIAAVTMAARAERDRAATITTEWDATEQDIRRRHDIYWEDLLGPPGPDRQEARP